MIEPILWYWWFALENSKLTNNGMYDNDEKFLDPDDDEGWIDEDSEEEDE